MNGFQVLKKVQELEEREQLPLKTTENIATPTPRFRSTDKDLLLETIERLTKENGSLKRRVALLEQKLASLDPSPMLEKVLSFQSRFEGHLKSLEITHECTHEHSLNESIYAEEMFEASAIAEEGELMHLKSDRRSTEMPVLHLCETSILEDLPIFQTQSTQLNEQIRAKEQEIQNHKDFIKQLKQNLENILVEHVKTKNEQEKNRREIQDLRIQLSLYEIR